MRSIRSKIGEIFVAYTYLTNKVQPQKILGTSVKLFCSTKTPRPPQRRNICNFQKFVWRGSDIYHVFQQLMKQIFRFLTKEWKWKLISFNFFAHENILSNFYVIFRD